MTVGPLSRMLASVRKVVERQPMRENRPNFREFSSNMSDMRLKFEKIGPRFTHVRSHAYLSARRLACLQGSQLTTRQKIVYVAQLRKQAERLYDLAFRVPHFSNPPCGNYGNFIFQAAGVETGLPAHQTRLTHPKLNPTAPPTRQILLCFPIFPSFSAT